MIGKYDAAGHQLASLQTFASLTDINAAGNIIAGSRFGQVYSTNSTLASATSFSVGGAFGPTVHVAFSAPVPEPETYALMLLGLGLISFTARRRKG